MGRETLQQIQGHMDPPICATRPDETALDAVKPVSIYGHFFGIQHTQDH